MPFGRRFPKGRSGNPAGVNGWTKARERVARALVEHSDELVAVLIELARSGDIKALQLALGPFLPEIRVALEHQDMLEVRWAKDESELRPVIDVTPKPNGHDEVYK